MRRRLAAGLLAVALVAGSAAPGAATAGAAAAQDPATQDPAAAGGPRVFLLTMGPGAQVWERFGPNALWLVDEATGYDVAYNWGLFDFAEPGFLANFVRGRLWYWMDGFDGSRTVAAYRAANRSVWAQELDLTPAQRRALKEQLERNALPENRRYLYDYYRDNCSTRVRDALDRVLGGAIRAATARTPSGTTYRWHTRRLTADAEAIYTGLELAMGQPIDRPISLWEEMFLPLELRDNLARLELRGPDGAPRPLVLSEDTLFLATTAPPTPAPPARIPAYLLVGVLIGATLAWAGRRADRSAAARWTLAGAGAAWCALVGLLGSVIALLWLGTDHWVTYANENLLQANPLPLGLAVLLPLGVASRRPAPPLRLARWLAATAAALAVLGLALQALPGLDQANGEIIALLLPAHLGLAIGLGLPGRTGPAEPLTSAP